MSSSFRSTACPETPVLYRPRRPERTLLHRLVRERLETYLALPRQGHEEIEPVPGYVEGAFRKYLECGIPSYGFARARCEACGYDFFVAFSCGIRGICPSCNTRRVVETAAYLTDHVLPNVPHRQWVPSGPERVRFLFRTHRESVGAVLRIFMRAHETTLRRVSPGSPTASRFGAVAFVHHFGSSLNDYIHFHCIVTDGVFSEGSDGEALFHEATILRETHLRGRCRRRRLSSIRIHLGRRNLTSIGGRNGTMNPRCDSKFPARVRQVSRRLGNGRKIRRSGTDGGRTCVVAGRSWFG